MVKLEIARINTPEDVEEYRKDALRTITTLCHVCKNSSQFTVNELNDGTPCLPCRNKGRG